MKQIFKSRNTGAELWIGSQEDYEKQTAHFDAENWAIVHACKEPYHRQLLGYTERAAPKDHPEYLFAEREGVLYLNLVDAPLPEYIPEELINKALDFIDQQLKAGTHVLVHCNQGESRAPSIGLLYLVRINYLAGNPEGIQILFKDIYPEYNPGKGMLGFVEQHLIRK